MLIAMTKRLLVIACCVFLASPLTSWGVLGTWEDCRSTKMILRNSMLSGNLDVISYSRLGADQSVTDCLALCRADQECYSFNYNKVSKWCYLGTTEEADLAAGRNTKWASGFRRCIEHTSNDAWENEEFAGGAQGTPPTSVTALNFIDSTLATNTLQFSFTPPSTAGTKADGSNSAIQNYKIRCMPTTGPSTLPDISKTLSAVDAAACLAAPGTAATGTTGCAIGGLADALTYQCAVVAFNTESLESTPVSSTATVSA